MHNRHLVFSSLILASLIICSCDQIRTMLGRPTSADIAAKKLRVEAYEANRQAREADSIARAALLEKAEKQRSEFTEEETLDSLKKSGCRINKKSSVSFSIETELPAKYSIIVGAFGSKENAEKLSAQLVKAGCAVYQLSYKSGLTAIAVDATDSIMEIRERYFHLVGNKIIPEDSWILVNE